VYREQRSRLKDIVVWQRITTDEDVRILPDGCMDLIWSNTGDIVVAGPDSHAQVFRSRPGRALVGLRFASGLGPVVLGVPAHELRDQRLPLDTIWPAAEVRRLAERIGAGPTPGEALVTAAEERLHASDGSVAATAEIAQLLRAGRSVASVAKSLGLSERQLRRLSLEAFGYGPKTLSRILRLDRAVRLAREGLPLVDSAAEAGYADQAHLARDVRALAGVSMTQLTR
jgi:AraC-like DNA-binding protein